MNAPPTASSHALNLAVSTGTSPINAQAKAQRLRTHAQEKRGGEHDVFKDHLKARQRNNANGDSSKRPESASEPTADAPTADVKRPSPPSASDSSPGSVNTPQANADGALTDVPDAAPQNAVHAAEQTAVDPAEPYIQEMIAHVLQGVDPALKIKPSAMARAAGTVAGNTALAMLTGQAQSSETHGERHACAAPSGEQALPAGLADAPPTEAMHTTDAPESRPQERVALRAPQHAPPAQDNAGQTNQAPAGSERAAAAVSGAVSAVNPAIAPLTSSGPRSSVTPMLVPMSGVTNASTSPGSPAATDKPTHTPPPLPQQIQHGLEVAMRELPTPAGDRLVTLKLNPSALGTLRIAMHVSGDTVQVRFQVGSAKAKASIGKSMDDLKAAIGRQGLRVESIEVEEDRALAAPTPLSSGENGYENAAAVPSQGQADAGKGFAKLLDAPHGPDGPRAADTPGRMPDQGDADHEGGVLQVLTFRLDAVG